MAGLMDAGDGDFWKMNSRDNISNSDDVGIMARAIVRENISREEFQGLLSVTRNYLSLPPVWGMVNLIADELIKKLKPGKPAVMKGMPLETEEPKLMTPEHNPDSVVEFILSELFPSEKREK